MRKFVTFMAALALLFSAAAFAESENKPETAAADTVLYYQPAGGEYYHLDPDCLSVNPKFLPLQDSFLYAELSDEPYRALKPCEVCEAPFRAENGPDSRDAAGAAEEDPAVTAALPEETVAADPSKVSRLVGLLITREDLSAYTGETGFLPASCTREGPDGEPDYRFGDLSGLRLICFIAPEDDGEGSCVVSLADEGISAVDFNLSEDGSSIKIDATISIVPDQDDELFYYNPVLLTDSGDMFAVPGDFMAISAAMNPPGSAVGQTIRDERKHTENGVETVDTTTVSVQIKAVREPLEIRLLQFNAEHELLKSEVFEPGAVPEQIVPLAEADYLLLETVEKDPEGGAFTRREAVGRDVDFLNTVSCREDGLCFSHYHDVSWNAVPANTDEQTNQ